VARPPLLQITVLRRPRAVTLRLDGELDLSGQQSLATTLRQLLDTQDSPRLLVIDAAQLRFLDGSGAEPLVAAGRLLDGRGGECRIVNASASVRRVLRLVDADGHIRVAD
jgi:anti-anti-sigma factor